MKNGFFRHKSYQAMMVAGGLLASIPLMQSCVDKDELTGQPEWLGNSIYERLQEDGNYKTTIKLIDDLGQTETLSKTGSKTLFVADDNAYAEWFKPGNNPWGVTSYEQLNTPQKKLLLNSQMVNNAYLVELLSSVPSSPYPIEGRCMRRKTAQTIYDSVNIWTPEMMPQTKWFSKFTKPIRIMSDNTTPTMIHFLPKFMTANAITNEDLSILTNGKSTSNTDAWVNGMKITERDITCKNGYIQKVNGVMTASPNMAQVLREHNDLSTWSSIVDRFCAPYPDDDITKEYNRLYQTDDTVYVLKYFVDKDQAYVGNMEGPKPEQINVPKEECLKLDPGWNEYRKVDNDPNWSLAYDAAAMIAPSNKAINDWWNEEGGDLKEAYGTLENVPQNVIAELVNVHLLPQFTTTIPSKFENILNDAQESMGVDKADVDSCFMANNGVVYMTNKVFAPASFRSVYYPTLVNAEAMNIVNWALTNKNIYLKPYLLSMDSKYMFIIPTNDALKHYIDPCSYAGSTDIVYEFYYDVNQKGNEVQAHRYEINRETGDTINANMTNATSAQVQNRLTDLLNNLIVVMDDNFQNIGKQTIYLAKSGAPLIVENHDLNNPKNIVIKGSYQVENGTACHVDTIFNKKEDGNGVSYVISDLLPMTGMKSVYATLNGKAESNEFFKLLQGGDSNEENKNLLVASIKVGNTTYQTIDYAMRLFDSYNYTVWVPNKDSIQALIDSKALPTWDDFDAQTPELYGWDDSMDDGSDEARELKQKYEVIADSAKSIIKGKIYDFIRYHIQDNSVYIGGKQQNNEQYETAKLGNDNRFMKLTVNHTLGSKEMTVSDLVHNRPFNVQTNDDLYNLMCREYQYSASTKANIPSGNIYTSSYAVIHHIDGVLLFSKSQWNPTIDKNTGKVIVDGQVLAVN